MNVSVVVGGSRTVRAFSLIELLVVIAIIGVLAGLLFPLTGAIKARAVRAKVQSELSQIAVAIENYREHYGQYPPDTPTNSPVWPYVNPLYFELTGTRYLPDVRVYETLDGTVRIRDTDQAFGAVFGTVGGRAAVRGFLNCTRTANVDDAPPARAFLTGLKPAQMREVTLNGQTVRLLTCSVNWPQNHPFQPIPAAPGVNPWRYVSSNPTNNAGGFDLWVDVIIGGKTNRIANWGPKVQIVP